MDTGGAQTALGNEPGKPMAEHAFSSSPMQAKLENSIKKVFIGNCTPEQEHLITILKTAQLLMECEKDDPTDQTKKTVKINKH